MSRPAIKGLVVVCLMLAAVAFAGCTNPDAPTAARDTTSSTSPQNAGEPTAPPPPSPAAQAPAAVQPTPATALRTFAELYVNWTYRTLTGNQWKLAAMSVGAARLSERQAAASSQSDTTITRGHIFNDGHVVSVARDLSRPATWVIVTREQTGGNTQYAGLPAAYHVTLAQLARVAGGIAVDQWSPQN
jgi:hypothetical protein